MQISYLPSNYLINPLKSLEEVDLIESNLFLRALRMKNTSESTVSIQSLRFDVYSHNHLLKSIIYSSEIIQDRIRQVKINLSRYEKNPVGAKVALGVKEFWDPSAFNLLTLKPGEETGIMNEIIIFASVSSVEKLQVRLKYEENGETKEVTCDIHVIPYKNKNQYIFPLQGTWLVGNNWDNPYYHRQVHSQEFAFDILQLDQNLQILLNAPLDNIAYQYYGENILSIGDGEVIEIFNEYPENPSALQMITGEKRRELFKKYGLMPVLAGNYIIINHSNDEYSFYAHLIPGSITVKPNDRVTQGQVIGKLGNSGNSDAPHLHFQLMQGPDFLSARGLPCSFSNIKDFTGNDIEMISHDYILISTL